MNAKQLEIARWLVACPKWVWLPGMKRVDPRHAGTWQRIISAEVRNSDVLFSAVCKTIDQSGRLNLPMVYTWSELKSDPVVELPDLDDDVTRIGVLAVVRRAWGTPNIGLTFAGDSVDEWWSVYVGGRFFNDTSEELALLLAMEAAP